VTTKPSPLAHPDRLFIDGRWVSPITDGTIDVVSAHSEEVIASVAEAKEADVDAAVAAARTAFDDGPWSRIAPEERAEHVAALSRALEPRMPQVARAWVDQIGALASVAPMVTGAGRFSFDYYAQLAGRFDWQKELRPIDGNGRALIVREPAGVVAAIAPWNNPFGIMTGKIAPALVAGCTVVMKPAPETPIEAYIIAEAAEAAGLPAGVLNLVTAHREASDYLVRHAGVDKVSFTGSVGAGRRIASVCGERMARCTLELGGKSAAIVLDDADIAMTARTLAMVITMSAGQVCATLSRAIVTKGKHDDLVAALRQELAAITVGHPDDPEARMGPLAMQRQRDRVEEYVAIAKAEGAKLVHGGGRSPHMSKGWYIDPTLFVRVEGTMRIASEEVFGPVLSVIEAEDEADAIRLANRSPFGLYGAVFTGDADRAYRVARGVRTGTVAHNGFRFDPALPFGGFKQSGIGREGGEAGLASFTELKSILLA